MKVNSETEKVEGDDSTGFVRFCVEDASRKNPFKKSECRRFEVHVWYPAYLDKQEENKAKFPVLLFHPELGFHSHEYNNLLKILANQGYVVFFINTPYLSQQCLITTDHHLKTTTTIAGKRRYVLLWKFLLRLARKKLRTGLLRADRPCAVDPGRAQPVLSRPG